MPDPAPRLTRQDIARRVARELPDGAVVNLGIGIPAMCANYLPPGVEVRYHAENGILGFREIHPDGEGDPDLMDAGGKFPKIVPGMAFFDSVESFALIRGGHVDVSVLGGLQVSRRGDLANWMIPQRGIGSIGGAMDLAANTKRVIVAMEHTAKAPRNPSSASGGPSLLGPPQADKDDATRGEGTSLPSPSQGEGQGRGRHAVRSTPVKDLLPNGEAAKIVDECAFPLTARRCVSMIVTDIAVIDVLPGGRGLLLREVAPGWDANSVQALSTTRLDISPQLREINLK